MSELNTVLKMDRVLELFTVQRPEWGVREVGETLSLPRSTFLRGQTDVPQNHSRGGPDDLGSSGVQHAGGRMGTKTKVAILGSGNIGTDLMYNLLKDTPLTDGSSDLELGLFVGIDADSDGLRRAQDSGIPTSHHGIQAILEHPDLRIVFDATSAKAHVTARGDRRCAARQGDHHFESGGATDFDAQHDLHRAGRKRV